MTQKITKSTKIKERFYGLYEAHENELSPFETYLKYNKKEKKNAVELAVQSLQIIIDNSNKTTLNILDVGCGDGEMTAQILSKLNSGNKFLKATCLDRSDLMIKKCEEKCIKQVKNNQIDIEFIITDWNDYSEDKEFDIILASYAYLHFPSGYNSLIDSLSKEGFLVVVNKLELDEPYSFTLRVREMLGEVEPGITIESVINHFKTLEKDLVFSEIKTRIYNVIVPNTENEVDFKKVIEFMMIKNWDLDIDQEVQKFVNDFLLEKSFKLKGKVGIVEVSRSS